MRQVKALVITGYGINCEMEMAYACTQAGACTDIAHISEIISGRFSLMDYHFLNLPGGFLDGDDLGSAQIGGLRFKHATIKTTGRSIFDDLLSCIEAGMLVLGVCNGFQSLVKSGLLPGNPFGTRRVSLTFNDSARFEDRWVNLAVNPDSPCVFTRGLERLCMPVRHGEGKFVCDSDETLQEIIEGNLNVLSYADHEHHQTMDYPSNPNGSVSSIAGICDASGRVFGLMPHPEAFIHATNHPTWTRMKRMSSRGDGVAIFENAVRYLAQ
ncbi:MAG TPA: phosphoribosylformylglycinamidine synthase subunit PurQ [Deltaproteobacteria bacterium]|nr:phosphoribosylformylglycinamidine synthase subunit PurQ [Deltaproteobacteria bacterium]